MKRLSLRRRTKPAGREHKHLRTARPRRLTVESLESRRVLSAQAIFNSAYSLGGQDIGLPFEGRDEVNQVARDAAGNVYVLGQFDGSISVDGDPQTLLDELVPWLSPNFGVYSTDHIRDTFLAKYDAAGDLQWASNLSWESNSLLSGDVVPTFHSMTIDSLGNVYAVGSCDLVATNEPSHDAAVVAKFAPTGDAWPLAVQWARVYSNFGVLGNGSGVGLAAFKDVAVDASGAVYVVGSFEGDVVLDDFGFASITAAPGGSGVLLKYDAAGAPAFFQTQLGVSSIDHVEVDSANRVVVAGTFEGTIDFDPGPGDISATAPAGAVSAYVLQLDDLGQLNWLHAVEVASGDQFAINDLAVGPGDQIYAAGAVQGAVDFDASAGVATIPATPERTNGFIWNLTDAGAHTWVRGLDGSDPTLGGDSAVEHFALDAAGNVYASGQLAGLVDMDPGTGAVLLDSTAFISKLTAAGDFAWATATGVHYNGLAVSDSGRIAAAGSFAGTIDADAGPDVAELTSVADLDIAIASYLQGIALEVVSDPETFALNLQTAITELRPESTGNAVVITATESNLTAVVAAVEAVAPAPSSPVVDVVVTLSEGEYGGQTIDVPAGVRLIINGAGGSVVFVGASPAFTLSSGEVYIAGVSFENSTDAPSILVTGGSLTVRNSTIRETTGGARAAIEVIGGTVDLGTLADPGGNTLILSGPGEFVKNRSQNDLLLFGNTFQTETQSIATDFVVPPQQRLIYDATSGNLALAANIVDVAIDFRPSNLNIDQNGAFSLVIFGSSLFNVTQVDAGSLRLAGVALNVFNQSLGDVDGNGAADLTVHFKTSDALKAALTALYADALLDDFVDDYGYSTKQDAVLVLDGAFGDLAEEFQGSDSTSLFLAGKSLKTLLASLGI